MDDDQFDRYTYTHTTQPDGVSVYGWGTYPESSVLAGQPMKCYIDTFDSVEEALAAYPSATPSSKWTEPQVSLNHLPDEGDPVPGGMYPDDLPDGD